MATTVPAITPLNGATGFLRGEGSNTTPYREWIASQGVPVTMGMSVYDINELPVEPWGETGVNMNFVSFPATGDTSDLWVMEIPPGGQFKPFHHMFNGIAYVLKGRGATTVWYEGGKKQSFEWQEGSLFAIPLNAWYEHFNGSGSEPARICMMTTAPLDINMHPNNDFIFNNPATFPNIYQGEDEFFTTEGKHTGQTMWQSNFVADCRRHETDMYQQRGAGGTSMHFSMGASFLSGHVSEFPPGTCKKAHRHGPGAHVLLLSGEGYSLTWADRKERYRIDWKAGTVYVPPNYWFHQHFNPHAEPARYLALTFPGHLLGRPLAGRTTAISGSVDEKETGDQVEYAKEDPELKRMFEEECAKFGTTVQDERMTKDFEEKVDAPRVYAL